MKILKQTSTLFITFLFITGCITSYNKGNHKIKLLLGPINNQQLNSQIIKKTIETQIKRLKLYGIPDKNIKTKIIDNKILIEVNEINDTSRIEKIITEQGKIEFWETYDYTDVYEYFFKANKKLKEINLSHKNKPIQVKIEDEGFEEYKKQNPLFVLLIPYINKNNQPIASATVGYSSFRDTSEVNKILKTTRIKSIFPHNMILAWEAKPMDLPMNVKNNATKYFALIALKAKIAGNPALEDDVIIHARKEKNAINGMWDVLLSMNEKGSSEWAIITRNNIKKQIAIVIDKYVYSAPYVNSEIKGGNSSISGNFTYEEASDLAIMLDTKSLPYKLKILQKEIIKLK